MKIAGIKLKANLILFGLGEFDVILGLDWLGDHQAIIDCRIGKVIIRTLESLELVFFVERVCTCSNFLSII